MLLRALSLAVAILSFGWNASAQSVLRVGTSADITALDPHYQFSDPNINITRQIYDSLFKSGPQKELTQGLATGGFVLSSDPTIWEINLRSDVNFAHGQHFTKADVICTFWRVQSYLPHSPNGFGANLRTVDLERTIKLNPDPTTNEPYKLRIATAQPNRFLRENLVPILIMSCDDAIEAVKIDLADTASKGKPFSQEVLNAFATGRLLNGTGPYRLQRWTTLVQSPNGAVAELVRVSTSFTNAAWPVVQYIPVLDGGRRMDLLKSGQLDVVASVPQSRVQDLQHAGAQLLATPGLRVIHLQMYQGGDSRENDPRFIPVRNEAGQAFPNPLRSLRFRQALALAVDKDRLVNIMGGLALPTDQYMLQGRVGYLPNRPGQIFNLNAARELLVRAAQESGLEFLGTEKLVFTIHGPNDRYPNDALILEEVARMWTHAFGSFHFNGRHYAIRFVAAAEPFRTFLPNSKKYIMSLLGGGVDNGHAEGALRLYFMPNSGLNLTNYNNAAVVSRYQQGVYTMNESAGDHVLTDALRIALEDRAIIPLYNQYEVWATRPGICFTPRTDGLTLADEFYAMTCTSN